MASHANAPVLTPEIPNKLYFRIGDVSRIAGVKPYVLRYWETEFPAIGPKKSGSNHRLYRRKDVELILDIKRLLYQERYTIEGARKHLAAQQKTEVVARAKGMKSAQLEVPAAAELMVAGMTMPMAEVAVTAPAPLAMSTMSEMVSQAAVSSPVAISSPAAMAQAAGATASRGRSQSARAQAVAAQTSFSQPSMLAEALPAVSSGVDRNLLIEIRGELRSLLDLLSCDPLLAQ